MLNSDEGPIKYGHVFHALEDVGLRNKLHPDQAGQLARTVVDKIERGAPLNDLQYVEPFHSAYQDMVMEAQRRGFAPNKGRMYEVNIRADPEEFLNWDKPLMQQSPAVREAISPMLRIPGGHGMTSGENLYRQLEIARHQPGQGHLDRAMASEAMREAGIPGIRYLDQGSRGLTSKLQILSPAETTHGQWLVKDIPNGNVFYRGADEAAARAAYQSELAKVPQPTSNYVLFRDDIIDILKKYGLAGGMAGSALPYALAPSGELRQ